MLEELILDPNFWHGCATEGVLYQQWLKTNASDYGQLRVSYWTWFAFDLILVLWSEFQLNFNQFFQWPRSNITAMFSLKWSKIYRVENKDATAAQKKCLNHIMQLTFKSLYHQRHSEQLAACFPWLAWISPFKPKRSYFDLRLCQWRTIGLLASISKNRFTASFAVILNMMSFNSSDLIWPSAYLHEL